MDEHKFMGHVLHLWLWALDHADDDGILPGLPKEVLGVQAGVPRRQCKTFIDALLESGFLDVCGTRLCIHDWTVYAGKLNERRAKERDRLAGKRATLHQRRSGVV